MHLNFLMFMEVKQRYELKEHIVEIHISNTALETLNIQVMNRPKI